MFPFFNNYPGTDLHEIDLAYILKLCAELRASNTTLTAWKATHEVEYAELADKVDGLVNNLVDVIVPWDSSIAYRVYSIVEYQGTNYIAIQDVPIGAMITNTAYWQPANTALEQINAIGVRTSDINKKMYYVTPELYGAVGDGVTDDTAAFAAAFAQSLPVMCYADKTYLITDAITTNTLHYFNGNGCTILNHSGSAGNNVNAIFVFNDAAIVENIHFNSDSDGKGSLWFYQCNCIVNNCTFTGIGLDNVTLDHRETQIECAACDIAIINNCYFYDNGYDIGGDTTKLNRCITIDTNGKYALVNGCVFEHVCQGVVSTYDHAIITGCKFTELSDNVFYDFSLKETVFDDCVIDGTDEECIVTKAPVANITNSHFYNVKTSCVSINGSMDTLKITNCSFARSADYAYKLNPIVSRDATFIVNNLIFNNNTIDHNTGAANYTFYLGTCVNLSICDNIIRNGVIVSNLSSQMIQTTDITGLLKFIGNIIEVTGSGTLTARFVINTDTGYGIIKDNRLTTNVRLSTPNGNTNLIGSVFVKQTGVSNLFSDVRIGSTVYATGAPTTTDIFAAGSIWINKSAGALYVTTGSGNWVQIGA